MSSSSRAVDQVMPVAIAWGPNSYDALPPFSPGISVPEYPFRAGGHGVANAVYLCVRESLRLLDLDAGRFGCAQWNPLGAVVQPGQTVLLKPNFIRHFRDSHPGDEGCLITHGAVIRAVIDYVYIALKGSGRIIVADSPQNEADFRAILDIAGLPYVRRFYRDQVNFDIEVYDLRPEQADKVDGVIVGHRRLPGDPAGYVAVNLGQDSAFAEIDRLSYLLYGSEYDTDEVRRHHHSGRHDYLISKTALSADVIVNLPKMKTHKKTGVTLNLKNFVGVAGNKNWLPHYRQGTPCDGGDEFADNRAIHSLERRVVSLFKRWFPCLRQFRGSVAAPLKALGRRIFGDTDAGTIRSGNWYGNDTIWRMVLDLNRILRYVDVEGRVRDVPQRKFFSVVDAIVAGEGNGPLDATARAAGLIVAGCDLLAVDLACTRLMGFAYRRIPVLYQALRPHRLPLTVCGYESIMTRSNRAEYVGSLCSLSGPSLMFQPHFGWVGHIHADERDG